MPAIIKREISSYFTSPLGYVFLAVFYGFSGLFLWMNCLATGSAEIAGVFVLMFFIMMILIPVLTMRTMADDKRQKTDQLTLTSPVSLFGLVMGKFLAAFFVFFCAVLILLVYAVFMSAAVIKSGNEFAWATFWGNFVGMILMGGVFISVGIFISNLTENQMIAAIGSIGANIVLCLFDIISNYIPVEGIRSVINSLSVFYKYEEFTVGIFSLKNILFFVSLIVIFNFLTMRFIERRRWS
ncbi:MAG: ABC transporter permease subunit [Oscillospiraceae bacterium]|nr:ABC transporter permease subunit [Oscillospiraceae bacterium]